MTDTTQPKPKPGPKRAAAPNRAETSEPIPDPPPMLTGDALRLWRRIVPLLESSGRADGQDAEALTALCMTWGRVCTLAAAVKRDGETIETPTMVRMNPAAGMLSESTALFIRIAAEFGLTPRGRNRMGEKDETAKNEKRSDGKPQASDFIRWPTSGAG